MAAYGCTLGSVLSITSVPIIARECRKRLQFSRWKLLFTAGAQFGQTTSNKLSRVRVISAAFSAFKMSLLLAKIAVGLYYKVHFLMFLEVSKHY